MFEFWIVFVVGAVLSWGVYVPVLHEGQRAMGGGNPSARPCAPSFASASRIS